VYDRHGYYSDTNLPNDVEQDCRVPGVNKGDHTVAKAGPVPAPIVDLIIPGDSGTVYTLMPEGQTSCVAATDPSDRGIHITPTIAGGTVYVGAYDGALYAFNLRTGHREWRTELGDTIGSSPAYYDGSVYIPIEYSTPSGSLFAVDATSGDVE